MLIDFFLHLRAARLPVSINELLTLLEALQNDVIHPSLEEFYFLARTCLIKDETRFDRYDQAFSEYLRGVTAGMPAPSQIPAQWFLQNLRSRWLLRAVPFRQSAISASYDCNWLQQS